MSIEADVIERQISNLSKHWSRRWTFANVKPALTPKGSPVIPWCWRAVLRRMSASCGRFTGFPASRRGQDRHTGCDFAETGRAR